jgi:hypothetical protein
MPQFLYTAWFLDRTAAPDDEDREWPACFIVDAPDENQALQWGDQLASDFSARRGTEQFLTSSIEAPSDGSGSLPIVPFGSMATDEEIGW